MRLTRAGEYAVRCVLYLAFKGSGIVVNRREIAGAMGIPDQFLSKIARQLSRAGIIEIRQGQKGGLSLLIAPEDLSLLQVVEAVIGEIYLNDCILNPGSCQRRPGCTVHGVWEKARNQLRDTLAGANFADLVGQDSCIQALHTAEIQIRPESKR